MKKLFCILLVFLFVPAAVLGEAQQSPAAPPEDGIPFDGPSSGMPTGMEGLSSENFGADDIPADYLEPCSVQGRVEKVRYTVRTQDGKQVKIATVYLPYGYDESDEPLNILYLLHASSGKPQNYLNPEKETSFKNLLDHMIADSVLQPLIVVAATYYPSENFLQYAPLEMQVAAIADFPSELVDCIIPAVESEYRTYAESTDPECITASRAHRGIAGFSLGGVATWDVFQKEMSSFRWFLPISEASWSDADGGTSGIWDSNVSAKVLYDAVLSQGFSKDDFRLFVATGTEDEAFDVSTSQMISLLEYADMFKPGDNTSCSMMHGGTHTITAVYTYLYHILPALFTSAVDSTGHIMLTELKIML